MEFFNKAWNWSLLPITFSINLPSVFRRMIGLNILRVLYEVLLGLGMMIDVNILKCTGQYLNLIHILAMSINLLRHSKSLIISLRCLQNNLSGPGVESLLHLYIAERNSLFEKGSHSVRILSGISSNSDASTCQYWAKLNDS